MPPCARPRRSSGPGSPRRRYTRRTRRERRYRRPYDTPCYGAVVLSAERTRAAKTFQTAPSADTTSADSSPEKRHSRSQHARRRDAERQIAQPVLAGQQSDRAQRNGDLDQQRGLRPAMMAVQQRFASVVVFHDFLFDRFGLLADRRFLLRVFLDVGEKLRVSIAIARRQRRAEFSEILFL